MQKDEVSLIAPMYPLQMGTKPNLLLRECIIDTLININESIKY